MGTAQQDIPVDKALRHTLYVLHSLREAAIEDCCERRISHETCMAEIVDRFIKGNDPNDEIGKEVYASMHQTN
tara:strand:- start:157 stop:375 length:219 start_codon:yes stop_codon:yes gene_type:complete